jgi:hypothetical protein
MFLSCAWTTASASKTLKRPIRTVQTEKAFPPSISSTTRHLRYAYVASLSLDLQNTDKDIADFLDLSREHSSSRTPHALTASVAGGRSICISQEQTLSKLALLHSTPVPLPPAAHRLDPLLIGSPAAFERGMDDNSRRRRQNEPPYSGPDPRFSADTQGRGFSGSSSERYRPAPLTTSPSAARGAAGATAYPGYYQEQTTSFPAPLPSNTMQYQSGYAQDQRQQQGFAGYNPDLMYNVSQQGPQNTVYDSTPQFQARQPAAMQMLSDVAAPYFPNESASAPGPPGLQHHASSGSSYQQHQPSPGDRAPLLQQSYPGAMGLGIPQPAAEIMEEEDFQAQGPGMEAAYTAYQTALKEIFQNIINGRLTDASQSLLEVSEWLLGHVGDLGKIAFLLFDLAH